MKIELRSGELCLADNQPVALRQARGLTVRCVSGIVWLTVEGEADDTFLREGQSHHIAGTGLVLLEGIGGGRIRLEQPARFPGLPEWLFRPRLAMRLKLS